MPVVDMSIEDLKKYQGISPNPSDFEQYWDESIAELDALDLEVEMTPAKFQTPNAECFDLYFTGVNGSRIYAKYLRPRNKENRNKAAVIEFHGYSGSSGDWAPKLGFINEGFSYLAMDVRGQGGRSQDLGFRDGTTFRGNIVRGLADEDPKKLMFREIFLDTYAMVKITRTLDDIDSDKIGICGGSQGGALTAACAALAGDMVNRAFANYPFLSDYRRVWEMDLDVDAYEELRYFLRKFDPRHEKIDEFFYRLGYIDIQNLASRITCKFCMQTGLIDTICPPSTQFAMYNKITSEKNVIFYPDYGHEGLPDGADIMLQFMLEMVK